MSSSSSSTKTMTLSITENSGGDDNKNNNNKGNRLSNSGMIPPQDRVLFHNRTLDLCDYLSDCVDAALREGTKSLPRVPHEETLLALLSKAYARNVSVLEAYMGRNIFSIQNLPPTRRRHIVQAFLDESKLPIVKHPTTATKDDEGEDAEQDKENISTNVVSQQQQQYPSKDQIPSSADMDAMTESLKNLRTQVLELKRRRQQVLQHCRALARVTVPIVPPTTVETIPSTVSSLLQGKQVLDDLTGRAQELVSHMDNAKRTRPIQDESALVPKKPKLGVEEAYDQGRHIGTKEAFQNLRKNMKQ